MDKIKLLGLLALAPFIGIVAIMSSPLLVLLLPLLVLYILWQAFGPVSRRKPVVRSVAVNQGQEQEKEGPPQRNVNHKKDLIKDKDGLTTIPQLMRATFEKYGSHHAVGQRKLIKNVEKDVTQVIDGKSVTKKHKIPWMTAYKWKSFTEMGDEITDFGRGLLDGTATQLNFGDKIAVFAGTRPEWQVTAQAAFENGLVVVTVYPSLGPDALAFSLNQTAVTHLVTQASLMETVSKTVPHLKGALKCIIYMDELSESQIQDYTKRCGVELVSWTALLNKGKDGVHASKKGVRRAPKPEDQAVIMYTSGSTGTPKGVMMSHANVVAAVAGIGKIPPVPISEKDVYIAYLPLAHVLELTAEMTVLAYGGSLGYSSPLTLRDDGVCDANGKPAGDLGQLKPTLMAAVPLILDRLRAAVTDQVNKGPFLKKILFKTAYYLKQRRYLAGEPTPILDKVVFSNVAAKFGGRLRYLISGGAPLSGDTHEFINICMCAPVMQGYGLTETMAGGTITHLDDRTTGNAGAPVACCQIKLVDVPEMGYTHLDKPKPRGEVWIGGPNVTSGYYESPELTAKSYHTDKDGVRYFATGDIAQWEDDGTLKIIDRLKDLVKLSHGEYIAVGNLESKYAHSELVDNICVVGDSHHGAPIALVAPNHNALIALADQMNFESKGKGIEAICKDPAAQKAVLQSLLAEADSNKFEKWERIAALHLYPVPWTPESGLLTEAMKLKRHEIHKAFKHDIEHLYKKVP